MAMRAATMSRMSPMDAPSALRESDNLFRKMVLLLLLVTASALSIATLFKQQTDLPLLLTTFFADTSLGLIAGLGSRFVLRQRALWVRSIVAVLLVIIGMTMIGYLTNWVLGVGPVKLESSASNQIQKLTLERDLIDQVKAIKINPRALFDFSKLDWADPIHLGLSLLMAGLALEAWSGNSASEPAGYDPVPAVSTVATPAKRRRRTSPASNGRARIHLPGSWFPRLRPNPTPQRRRRSGNGSRLPVVPEAKIVKEPAARPKRRRSRRKPQIQFALVEEHRCPYCLDAVTHNDPRGVKECEVCHSLHHADCWAITGVCQVPHLNT